MRILIILALVALLVILTIRLARKFINSIGGGQSASNSEQSASNRHHSANNGIAQMVECSVCSTFVSENEAIYAKGRYFCSSACLGEIENKRGEK